MKPVLALLPISLLLACSPKSETPASVTITDAWCRPTPAGALAGACYLTLTASADDRLTAVETPLADRGEIHTMDMAGGVMRMRKLDDGLALPKSTPVLLKPGAEHLMLIAPKQQLAEGGSVPLTLKFAKAPTQAINAPVRLPAMPGGHAEEHGQ